MDKNKFILDKNRRLYNVLLLVVFTAILFFITIYKMETNKLNLKTGDVAPIDIRATMDLEDRYTTEKLRQEAMDRVEPRYRISPSIQMTMKNQIKEFLDTTRDIKGLENTSINKKSELLLESQNLELTSKETNIAVRMDYKTLNDFENILMDLINQVMGNGIKESELEYEKANLKAIFESLDISDNEKHLGLVLMESTIKPNEFLDKLETERKKEEEANKIKDIILMEDEIIAYKGSVIKEREIELIRESGLLKEDNKIRFSLIAGVGIIILLSMSIVVGYIYYYNNDILYNNHLLILLIITLMTILISKELYNMSPYIMPIATAALLISIIIDSKLALIVNMFISFYLGFILKLDGPLISMYVLSGSVSALLPMKQGQRYSIFIKGAIIGIVNILTIIGLGLIKGVGVNSIIELGYSFLNGVLAAILTLGSLPLWENVFSVLTSLKLLELSNHNQPLLKKLLIEAPGTYHHSILVGNLAEAASEAISANPLIARVGSYYHDIGKTVRPYFFAENQFGMENPHDKLQPMQSASIITSHTEDGVKLGKEEKLPREILDIIEQHHGDTMVAYFYYKAKEMDKDINISIDEFRYKGKKPQSKEATIVMLADSCEAAVRSIKDITKEKIEDMVRKVIQGKLKDGQLDECDITLKEVETIIQSFIKVLTGIYHDRIEYPNMEEESEAKE